MLKSVTRCWWNSNGQRYDDRRPARCQRNDKNGLMGVAKQVLVFNDHARPKLVRLLRKAVASPVQDNDITCCGLRHVHLARFDPKNRRIRGRPGRHGFARQRVATLRESLLFAQASPDRSQYCADTSQARFHDLLHRLRASRELRHPAERKSEQPSMQAYYADVFQSSITARTPGIIAATLFVR